MIHKFASKDELNVKFLHRNHITQKFIWGPSVKHGFHCFNNFAQNGDCEDFEWRNFKDCPDL